MELDPEGWSGGPPGPAQKRRPTLTLVYETNSSRFHDLDTVRVMRDVLTDEGDRFAAGSVGTIVATWHDGAAYEVEFDGSRMSLATVSAEDLEPVPTST